MLSFLNSLFRPILPIAGGMTAWVISQACGANYRTSLAAALAIGLSTIGASLYHIGDRHEIYARKAERVEVKDPKLMVFLGQIVFSCSIAVAVLWLPKTCIFVCMFNSITIAAYSARLSGHWKTKNLTMAIVCSTPVAIGWFAGNFGHPIVPWALAIAAVAHLSRELVKDVEDRIANHGFRVTLPMVLGPDKTLQIAGGLLLIAAILPIFIFRFTRNRFQESMVGISILLLLITAGRLMLYKNPNRGKTAIRIATCFLVLALL